MYGDVSDVRLVLCPLRQILEHHNQILNVDLASDSGRQML
jgi:hypothetical protein